ncbi:hypothetical protein LJC58_06315 [Lachnospiraceae bacterium OttesenSCG-928-D06]|nr:hypothetical protein [Lachnospiraceae bacterium OttesenSCG-928-D06]
MNDGVYDGRQIVSSEWIEKCISPQTIGLGQEYPNQEELEYGYGLWRCEYNNHEVIYSYGKKGQYLLMIPEKKLLITTTSDEKSFDLFYRDRLLAYFLLTEIK